MQTCDEKQPCGDGGLLTRELYWNEMSIEQKLQLLREIVLVHENEDEVHHLMISRLSKHEHGQGGVVVPLSSERGNIAPSWAIRRLTDGK